MESIGLEINIYILLYVIISDFKNEVYTFALDCILTLYVPRIKNTLKVIKELRNFFGTAEKCIKTGNFMSITEKLAKMVIELAIAIYYQDNVSVFTIHDLNVSLLQLVE